MWYEAGDERFVRYLLGGLTTTERDQLEDEYFADDAVHEQLLAIECELIDAYVRDELSPDDRRTFEERFLATPGGRARVERARLIGTYFSPHRRLLKVPRFEPLTVDQPGSRLPTAAFAPGRVSENLPVPDSAKAGAKRSRLLWDSLVRFLRLQPATVRIAFVVLAFFIVLLPSLLVLRSRRSAGIDSAVAEQHRTFATQPEADAAKRPVPAKALPSSRRPGYQRSLVPKLFWLSLSFQQLAAKEMVISCTFRRAIIKLS